jgi:hypothetical protein
MRSVVITERIREKQREREREKAKTEENRLVVTTANMLFLESNVRFLLLRSDVGILLQKRSSNGRKRRMYV